ncbi:MAG: hypothetical protein ACYDAC_10675 [Candidatus Dormibacteria bacterium]
MTAIFPAAFGFALLPLQSSAAAATHGNPMFASGPVVAARASEPVVITGANIPSWSRAAPQGNPAPYPSGVSTQYSANGVGGDGVRSAHNGYTVVPQDARTGVNPDQIAAYRWDGSQWSEVPVQVDQMYPFYLANGHSSFSFYSGTSYELTYDWTPNAHSVGEESWKQVFGGTLGDAADNSCNAHYQDPGAAGAAELTAAETLQPGASYAAVSQPTLPGIPPDDYTKPTPDPVTALNGTSQLTDSDQIAMMAGDAGLMAPAGTPQPAGTFANNGQQITITDPTAASDGSAAASYIYLFLQPGGSSYNASNGYVSMSPNADAYQWIDANSFSKGDPEAIGISNQSYGPNIPGMVCVTAPNNPGGVTTPNGVPRFSNDRQPRDDFTITTPTYEVQTTGRWMVRQLHVSGPGTTYSYGPNLISRWKGRAFQSSPDSTISVVGFEDEQTNWEMNSALLGWKVGPVRAIREVWGADSGTNVTKTEIYYRDSYDYSYHLRVHPIPPDGLYTSWDFRYGYVNTYYNGRNQQGVPIDGTNSHSVGEVDKLPVTGQPAYFDTCDPTYDICSAVDNPEEVSGNNGSMVFVNTLTSPTDATQPAIVPFYEDNACFDDGTGDAPVPRPWPGEASTSSNVQNGYVAYWKAHGAPPSTTYANLTCAPPTSGQTGYQQPGFDTSTTMPFQGAIGELGVHYFFTQDSDHRIDEVDADSWVYPVPGSAPANLISPTASAAGQDYGNDVVAPLQAVVTPFAAPASNVAEAPAAALLPLLGLLGLGILARRRRRSPA